MTITIAEEIERHPALLAFLAAVIRPDGYEVQTSMKWGLPRVKIIYLYSSEIKGRDGISLEEVITGP